MNAFTTHNLVIFNTQFCLSPLRSYGRKSALELRVIHLRAQWLCDLKKIPIYFLVWWWWWVVMRAGTVSAHRVSQHPAVNVPQLYVVLPVCH